MATHLRQRANAVEAALAAIAAGELVVVVDAEDRANEGVLVMAADAASAEQVAFMVRHTSGVICVALDPGRCERLDLPLMVSPGPGRDATGAAFTISVDLREGTTAGISSADRAATARALAEPWRIPGDFNRPGHVFPLRARSGGVLARPGRAEAAIDLARLAGRTPAGVLCEVVLDGDAMASLPELIELAARHGLVLVSVRDLIAYRRRTEKLVVRLGESRLPTRWGEFHCVAFESRDPGDAGHTHLALVRGDPAGGNDVLVRIHRACLTGDIFGSRGCDCGPRLHDALRRVVAAGTGVVVYLRGDQGRDHDDSVGAQILADLGVTTGTC